jgi:hypothetical protein
MASLFITNFSSFEQRASGVLMAAGAGTYPVAAPGAESTTLLREVTSLY